MRKRDRLYTVNKFNKRLFSGGGGITPLSIDPTFNKGVNFGGINPFEGVSYNLTDKVTTPPELDTSGLKGLKYNTGNFFTKNKGALMTAGAAIGSIPTGDPRGMWDTADPLYHLAGGRESGVGNAMSDAGVGLAQAGFTSGNLGLALTGGIVKGVGSLINAAFGIKENKKNTNFIKQNTQKASSMGNVLASAASNEDLVNQSGNMVTGSGFKWDDLYTNGWFTSRGTRLGNNLIAKENTALAAQSHGLTTGARNVDYNLDSNIMRNFGAFGGPLDMLGTNNMGAIGYGFMSDYLNNKKQQIEADSSMTNVFAGVPSTMFAGGGKIHIKKKNRGKFTETMKRTGKSAEELSHSKNPLTRKRAIFALNARKWHHADGGPLNTLYQEDYPLFAFGGDMETNIADFPTGLTHIDTGGSHEENPYEGVQLGTDRNGVPNLVEEGEVVFDDYVYSARIPIDQTTKEKFHINKKKELTYAELAKKLEKEIAERPNDPLSKAGFEAQMHDLAEQQERQKKEAEAQRAKEAFEALTPEEQTALMQQAAQQEQMAQQVQAQQAMQEQASQQQTPQETAMDHPATEEEAMMQQGMAEGGNIKSLGGGITPTSVNVNSQGWEVVAPALKKEDANTLDALALLNAEETLKKEEEKKEMLEEITEKLEDLDKKRPEIHYYAPGGEIETGKELSPFYKWLFGKLGYNGSFEGRPTKLTGSAEYDLQRLYDYMDRNEYDRENDTLGNYANHLGGDLYKIVEDLGLQGRYLKDLTDDDYRNILNNYKVPWNKNFNQWWKTYVDKPFEGYKRPDFGRVYTFFTGKNDKSDSRDVYNALMELYNQDPNKFLPYDIENNTYVTADATMPQDIVDNLNAIEPSVNTSSTRNYIPFNRRYTPIFQGSTELPSFLPQSLEDVPYLDYKQHEPTLALSNGKSYTVDPDPVYTFNRKNEGLRKLGAFAPLTNLAMMVGGVGKPDYTRLDNAVNTLNNVSLAAPIFIGDYLKYTPMDIWSEQNRQNASARATDRVITNTNNPAKMAGLLASGYNDQLASGDLYRKALEYNDAKRAQIADFNRGTNIHNMTAANQASQFNASAINNNRQHQAALAMQAAKERLDSDASWYNSLYGNINNLYKGLSELGRENVDTNWRNILLASGAFGTPNKEILEQAGIYTKTSSKGGKISKKKNKRRGLTC